MFRRLVISMVAVATAALGVTGPAHASDRTAVPEAPTTLRLPDGFRPDGIAIRSDEHRAYFGSLNDGAIYQVDLSTGEGSTLSTGTGGMATGMKAGAGHLLYVAGGSMGDGRIVDSTNGTVLADYELAADTGFINDVLVTRDAVWFTDSFNPVLYELPLHADGSLPLQSELVTLPLTGDLQYADGFNVSGIASTPDGKGLIIAQISTGKLFEVNPLSGVTRTVDTGVEALTNPDGMLLVDHTLYVAENRKNEVASLQLDDHGLRAETVLRTTDARFDIPTRIAADGDRLYLPNARTTTTPTPTTPYTAVAIPKP
ncbi:superoxide dismutase [Streptomyces sp. NPDC056061]|uniref:superoxide dismutase n=1 Tax=Streptomyces sp. NPDC056061 TaxID=3345700 RepID=UPI0035E2099C